jgi:hypothetical protein
MPLVQLGLRAIAVSSAGFVHCLFAPCQIIGILNIIVGMLAGHQLMPRQATPTTPTPTPSFPNLGVHRYCSVRGDPRSS